MHFFLVFLWFPAGFPPYLTHLWFYLFLSFFLSLSLPHIYSSRVQNENTATKSVRAYLYCWAFPCLLFQLCLSFYLCPWFTPRPPSQCFFSYRTDDFDADLNATLVILQQARKLLESEAREHHSRARSFGDDHAAHCTLCGAVLRQATGR